MTARGRLFDPCIALLGLPLAAIVVWQARNAALDVFIMTVLVGSLTCWIIVQDLKTFTISNSAILILAILGAAYRWSALFISNEFTIGAWLATCLDALLPGGMLLVFREIYYRRKGFDGLGLGDVKLAAVGGLLVGAVGFSWALFFASALALALVGLGRLFKIGKPLGAFDRLAFGAVLAPAIWTAWLAEQLPTLLPFADR